MASTISAGNEKLLAGLDEDNTDHELIVRTEDTLHPDKSLTRMSAPQSGATVSNRRAPLSLAVHRGTPSQCPEGDNVPPVQGNHSQKTTTATANNEGCGFSNGIAANYPIDTKLRRTTGITDGSRTFPHNFKMIKAHSESSYLGVASQERRRASGKPSSTAHRGGQGSGLRALQARNTSNYLPPSAGLENRGRSISLQNPPPSALCKKPEVISLSNMPRELGLEKKNSISFSAVGFMVESMHRLHSQITDKKPDVEKAVLGDDFTTLQLLCMEDEAACGCAALVAIKEDKEEMLAEILDIFDNNQDEQDGGGESEFPLQRQIRPKLQRQASEGNGLLHIAVQKKAYKCIDIMLQRGFSPNYWNNSNRYTPLHYAAINGDLRALHQLTRESALEVGNLTVGEDRDGQSILHAAVRANQVEVVKYLLERKANKTGKGKFTETPLHTAAEHNYDECARILLNEGVLVDALRGESQRDTALHIAAANGYVETAELLLLANADTNAKNSRRETPLHLAAKMHSAPVMRLLMEHGADVDSVDCEGRPPLQFAINSNLKGATECMQLLLTRGANINQGDDNGTTALHLAALNRKIRRVKLLIKNGADLCLRNKAGKSALYFVMKYVPNSLKTIEDRLDGGIQVGQPEQEYETSVKMDFNLLIPSSGNCYISEVGLFTEILQMHNNDPTRLEKILMHPLSLSFLHLKWQQIKWLYYLLILSSHFIYSVTYSVYIASVFNTLCKPKDFMVIKDLSLFERVFRDLKCDLHSSNHRTALASAQISWLLLILFNIIYAARETTKFLHLRDRYFKELESILNLLTILSFPFISFHFNPFQSDAPKWPSFASWQFHAAGIGVLITWILQMFLIGKVPRFGKYVQMLMNVGWSFFNFFVAYFSLILGFGLSFVVLFPKEVSFMEALSSPIKILVMMTGEIEYNDLYYPQRDTIVLNITQSNDSTQSQGIGYIDDEDIPQHFPITAHAILTTFIIIVSIVIMNLLFGMAVSDVQELYKKSRLHQSIQQVHLISYMESILFSPLFDKLPACGQKFLRRKLHGLEGKYRNVWEYDPDSYDEHKILPSHLIKSIKDKCDELRQKRGSDSTSLKALHHAVRQMEQKFERMFTTLIHGTGMETGLYSMAPTLSLDEQSFSEDEDDDDRLDELNYAPTSGGGYLTSTPRVTHRMSQIQEEDDFKFPPAQ
eukprot:maker-scaffold287_size221780-snap-gene-0.24 protein:Tk01890 transcript:maker-scaffold287_size221780-snap-gene-0.24-mRNA-1 annotation:"transient receptor potential channel pyrexia"